MLDIELSSCVFCINLFHSSVYTSPSWYRCKVTLIRIFFKNFFVFFFFFSFCYITQLSEILQKIKKYFILGLFRKRNAIFQFSHRYYNIFTSKVCTFRNRLLIRDYESLRSHFCNWKHFFPPFPSLLYNDKLCYHQ